MRIGILGTGMVGTALGSRLAQAGHDVLVNATAGAHSLAALRAAGADRLDGMVLLDAANPLDFSAGFPPSLDPVNTDSLGERIQAAFPRLRVVKTLNTVLAAVMVEPSVLAGPHDVFVAGEDDGAKRTARGVLADLGWPADQVVDLGGIRAARGTEMYMALWLSLDGALGTGHFNIRVVRA